MDEYQKYLAQKILTEDQLVTYQQLSRALRVHVNTAKEMLYGFQQSQNDKRPGALHATYVIYGIKKDPHQQQDEEGNGDVEMADSIVSRNGNYAPFSDLVPTRTLSLIKEEHLKDALAQYDEISSIHIYSLAPQPVKDLQLLADPARQILESSLQDDASVSAKVFGTIANSNLRRRDRRGTAVASKAEPKPAVRPASQPAPLTKANEEPKPVSQDSTKGSSVSAPAKKSAAPALLKRQSSSSGIGQMFAKAAAKPKKPSVLGTPSSNASAAEESQDVAMSDDGEDESEPVQAIKEDGQSSGSRQTRKNRQAELQRMMEESDDEEAERPDSPTEEPAEAEQVEVESQPIAEQKEDEPAEVVSSAGDGRRRGRRRVTRKKQVLDDKGYLVTKQEEGWESFSEDEAPPPSKQKPALAVKSEVAAAAKAKKAAAKGSQGNIMSFFSKK